MVVRAYIDGFNLYYGGKGQASAATAPGPAPSWKWIDLRALAVGIAQQHWAGRAPVVEHVTYCTARVMGDRSAVARQATYLRALELSRSADLIEYGLFKETYRRYPRATKGKKGRPILVGGGASNDSDLALPVKEARELMPVGTVNPHPGPVHGSLRPTMTPGCGHWYHSLTLAEFLKAQLPDPCHGIRRPAQW